MQAMPRALPFATQWVIPDLKSGRPVEYIRAIVGVLCFFVFIVQTILVARWSSFVEGPQFLLILVFLFWTIAALKQLRSDAAPFSPNSRQWLLLLLLLFSVLFEAVTEHGIVSFILRFLFGVEMFLVVGALIGLSRWLVFHWKQKSGSAAGTLG